LFGASGVEQQAAGMICEVEILGREFAGLYREADSPFACADRSECAAGMAISLHPIGMEFDQPFIGRCSLRIATAIAEQPGTEMRDLVVVGSGCEGQAAALDGVAAATVMKQLFTETTREPSHLRSGYFITTQVFETKIQRAAFQRAGKTTRIDRQSGVIVIETQP